MVSSLRPMLLGFIAGIAGGAVVVAIGNRRWLPAPGQEWFWTPEWQAGEAQASEQIRLGMTQRFEHFEHFEKALLDVPFEPLPQPHHPGMRASA
jgi:hypothetical protein